MMLLRASRRYASVFRSYKPPAGSTQLPNMCERVREDEKPNEEHCAAASSLIKVPQPPEEEASYSERLRFGVGLGGLLTADDAPHPYQVFKDVRDRDPEWRCTKQESAVLIAHSHVVLRMLEGMEGDTTAHEVTITSSRPGELTLTTPQKDSALHWAYHDTLQLWDTLKADHEVGMRAHSAMLRCASVTGDTQTGKNVFESYPNREKRHTDVTLVNGLMWCFAEAGDIQSCMKLLKALKLAKARPNCDSYEAVLHSTFKNNELPTVLQTWRVIDAKGVIPRPATWEMTVIGCLDMGFKHHSRMFYDRYKATGATPSEYVQMRMSAQYSDDVSENLTPGKKIKNAVARSPHLSYKMMIDFCRVRSMRDITLPDHVPAVQSHYYAPVEGAGRGMDVEYAEFLPGGSRQGNRLFTSRSGRTNEFRIRGIGDAEFAPPGSALPVRSKGKKKGASKAFLAGSYQAQAGTYRSKGKIIHDYTGNKGKGLWCDERFTLNHMERDNAGKYSFT